MKFLKLILENFRGIKALEIDFGGKNTDILGANATGKTTIANAVCWLLTGQAITGEKDFSPKTADSHNIHHKAELTIQMDDGSIVKLAKDYYEKWTKKKGSQTAELTGHTTDYTINDVPVKEKDYKAQVETLLGGGAEIIKMLLIVGYFAEDLNQDDRRKILVEVCGDISDDQIMQDEKLQGFKEMLLIPGTDDQYYSVDEFKAIAAKQKSKLKKTLETLPIRIDELEKGIPMDEDQKALETNLEDLRRAREEITNSDKAEVKQAIIKGLEAEKAHKEAVYYKDATAKNKENQQRIDSLQAELRELNHRFYCNDKEIQDLKVQRVKLLEEWDKTVAEGKWDDGNNICPCCGREFPADQIAEKKAKLRELTEKKKAEIREKGKSCSESVIQGLLDSNDSIKQQINSLAEEKEKLASQLMDLPPFAETEEARAIDEKIKKLMDEVAANAPDPQALKAIDADIKAVNEKLGAIAQTEKTKERIEELEEEQRTTAAMLEKSERAIYLCEEFVRLKVKAITEKINARFRSIGWLLFKDQINGGLRECCEPLIPNDSGVMVEYKSANTAAKVNAGVEIVKVLGNHYGISLPTIIDQAESVCNIPWTDGQLIRLVVSSDDTKLRVINKGE